MKALSPLSSLASCPRDCGVCDNPLPLSNGAYVMCGVVVVVLHLV